MQILEVHIKKIRARADVDLEQVAALTTGFTGADLANLVNEAALLATRRKARGRDDGRLHPGDRADRRRPGEAQPDPQPARSARSSPITRWATRWSAMALPGTDPVHKVSIIPRGVGALGYTIQRPTEDRFLMTQDGARGQDHGAPGWSGGREADLRPPLDRCRGRSGPGHRHRRARSSPATAWTRSWARSPTTSSAARFLQPGRASYRERRFSEDTAREIDLAVRRYRPARRDPAAPGREPAVLERSARELLEVETFDEARLKELTRELRRPEAPARAAE